MSGNVCNLQQFRNGNRFAMLENINGPEDIRKFDNAQLEQLCAEIRQYIINCCATNPGHLGSSLGAVELIVGLHYVFNTPGDKIVFDVGHQAYAHKILTGRREAFLKNRMKGGLSGFPKGKKANMTHSVSDILLHPYLRLSDCLWQRKCRALTRKWSL